MAYILSQEEKDLLAKLGLPESILSPKVKRVRKEKDPLKEPKTTELEGYSGTMTLTCLCCGSHNSKYVDYVKRADCPGYYMKTVEIPQFPIIRNHTAFVYACDNCEDNMLEYRSNAQLIKMVKNLRIEVRRKITLK